MSPLTLTCDSALDQRGLRITARAAAIGDNFAHWAHARDASHLACGEYTLKEV